MSKGTRSVTGSPHYPLSAMRYPLVLAVFAAIAACAPKGEALYARAEQALEKGDVRSAVIDLRALVQKEPSNGKARALLGRALISAGDVNGGAIELQKAHDLGVSKALTVVPDCQVLVARAEYEEALEACKPGEVEGGERTDLQIVVGQALLNLKRAPEAQEQFKAAYAAEPDRLDALLGLAKSTYDAEDLAAARAVLDGAQEKLKERVAYWLALGTFTAEAGDMPGAEEAFVKAVDVAAKSPEPSDRLQAQSALVQVQLRQNKVKEAVASSDRLMNTAPDNPMVKQLRGQVLAADGRLDDARTLLEAAVAAMPGNSQARTLLGIVNVKQGNLGQAEMHFASVVASDPANLPAQRALAETRAKLYSPAKALESMKPALQEDSADPSLLVIAARLSQQAGDGKQALAYLAEAESKAVTTPRADLQYEIASGYLLAGDPTRAIRLLEAMPPDSVPGYQREYLLMQAYLRKGDRERAMAEADALLERTGDDPAAKSLVASVYTAGGDSAAGRAQINEVLKSKPGDAQGLLALARLDLSEGKLADAEKNYRKALEVEPKNLMAETGLAAVLAARGDRSDAEKWLLKARADHPDSLETVMALVQFHMGGNDYAKARAVVDEASKQWPDNGPLSNAMGVVQLGLKDGAGALESFRKATVQSPGTHGFALNLARAHALNRDVDGALKVLDELLKGEPKYLPALQLASSISLQSGRFEKATGYVERVRALEPDAQGTYMLLGDLALGQKLYRQALEQYRKASAKGTNRGLVFAEYQAARLSGAANPEKGLEDWLASHPDDAGAAVELAQARQQAGRAADAVALYEQALAKAPNNAIVLNNLAVLYQETGNPKAVATAEKAHAAADKVPAIKDTYGWILFQNGQVDRAEGLLRDAAQAMPKSAEVQYHYAAVLAKRGKKPEATAILKKAVNGEMPAAAKADAQKLLRELSK